MYLGRRGSSLPRTSGKGESTFADGGFEEDALLVALLEVVVDVGDTTIDQKVDEVSMGMEATSVVRVFE